MDSEIKAILFDLGNVLVDFDYNISAKRMSHFCGKNKKEIYDLFFDSEITGLFQAGKLSPLDFFSQLKESLGLRLSYEAFVPVWNDIFFLSAKNRSVYSIAGNLSRRYKVYLASNINILHYEYLKKRFPVFNIFHKIFLSYELGFIKPDPRFYQTILESLGICPENTFYTDDRQELIDSAKNLGIRAHVFKGAKELREDLLSQGVTAG